MGQASNVQNVRTATEISGNGQTTNSTILKGARRNILQKAEYVSGKVK